MKVHFWTLHDVTEITTWDPDLTPGVHLDGFGHTFLEPYVRLRATSDRIVPSIGNRVPRRTDVVVASLDEVRGWKSRPRVRTNLSLMFAVLRCPRLVMVRNDLPSWIAAPPPTSIEVVPNQASVLEPERQVAIRTLPQRGLKRRDPARDGRIEVLALKAMSTNVPNWVTEPSFIRQLGHLGLVVRVDTEEDPAAWPDFTDVDLVLCVRRHHDDIDEDVEYQRKPPTKLVNAWAAGAIPLVAREAAYLELANDGRDTIFVDHPQDVVEAVRSLKSNPSLAERIREEGSRRARDFTVGAVVEDWERLLDAVPSRSRLTLLPHLAQVTARIGRAVLRRFGLAAKRRSES